MNVDSIIGRCTAAESEELARAVLNSLDSIVALRIVIEWAKDNFQAEELVAALEDASHE